MPSPLLPLLARAPGATEPLAEDPFPAGLWSRLGEDSAAAADLAAWSPLHTLLCLSAAGLAGVGALAAASLIGYSPTLLAAYLDEAEHPQRDRLKAELDAYDSEYLVVAMACTTAGWIAGLWALAHAIDAARQPMALLTFGALMLLVAGSLPVAISQVRAERTLLAVRPCLRAGWWLLRWPLVLPVLWLTRASLFVLRIRQGRKTDPAEVQRQVLAAVADTVAETQGDEGLADAERTWIGNIVGLQEMQVTAVMTPRPDLVAFEAGTPLREAVQQALEHGFSRYPVYRERLDEVVGVFYVKDALRLLRQDQPPSPESPIREMLREPLFVPESMGLAQLLRRFQATHLHLAVVLDEFGTTAGIVTVEDVLEEIVGDIRDEYDAPKGGGEAPEQIRVVEAGRIVEVPARTPVAEVNQLLGTSLPEEGDWETIAGLVIAQCNHIPREGETVVVDGTEFRVLAADERRLLRLRITAGTAEPAKGR